MSEIEWKETEVDTWFVLAGYATELANILHGGRDDDRKKQAETHIRRLYKLIS